MAKAVKKSPRTAPAPKKATPPKKTPKVEVEPAAPTKVVAPKAPAEKPKFVFQPAAGMSEVEFDAFFAAAENADRGRAPWPEDLKGRIKVAVSGMSDLQAVKQKINTMVVDELGLGVLNRGPL